MFTNEVDFSETITTIMDEEDQLEDLQLIIQDEGAYFRQWNEMVGCWDIVVLSHDMFSDLLSALNEGEGFFVRKDKK